MTRLLHKQDVWPTVPQKSSTLKDYSQKCDLYSKSFLFKTDRF